YSDLTLKKSTYCTDKEASKTIKIRVVEAKEIDCPKDQESIHWILLTTHQVRNIDEAKQIISWYRGRWNVEQVFRTLKRQGLDIESSQVETAEGLMKLTIMALFAAI